VLRYGDVERVTLVDIDPRVVRLAAEHPDLIRLNQAAFRDSRVHVLDAGGTRAGEPLVVTGTSKLRRVLIEDTEYATAEVRVLHLDADLFLRGIRETFDVAILDFPDPTTVELAKLFSVDFYRQLAARLAPGAVVGLQATSPYHARKVFLCIGRTLRAAGYDARPYHDLVPTFGEWGWYLAWRDGGADPERRLQALERLPVETRYLTPELLRASFLFGKGWLDEGASELSANTKLNPVMVNYYREAWR
jgi:spermidine synthase